MLVLVISTILCCCGSTKLFIPVTYHVFLVSQAVIQTFGKLKGIEEVSIINICLSGSYCKIYISLVQIFNLSVCIIVQGQLLNMLYSALGMGMNE